MERELTLEITDSNNKTTVNFQNKGYTFSQVFTMLSVEALKVLTKIKDGYETIEVENPVEPKGKEEE